MIDLKNYMDFAPILMYDVSAWGDLLTSCPLRSYRAGEFIRQQGMEEKDVFIAKNGFFSVSYLLDDGTETIQHVGGPGCMFGYVSTDSDLPYMSTARAFTDCEIYMISNKMVRELKQSDQLFVYNCLTQEKMKSDLYFKRICLLAMPQSHTKLCYLLLGFAASVGVHRGRDIMSIPLELTHQMISDILHVNRVTISRQMSFLAKQGAVYKMGKYYELNLLKMEKLLEETDL